MSEAPDTNEAEETRYLDPIDDLTTPEGVEAETVAGYSPPESDDGEAAAPAPGGESVEVSPAQSPDRPERFVPHAALHEERLARRALEERYARLEARTNAVLEHIARAAEANAEADAAASRPDPEEDMLGAFRHLQERHEALERHLAEQYRAGHEREVAEERSRQVIDAYRADAGAFKARVPDFRDAYAHLRDAVKREYMDAGYDEASADARLVYDELELAHAALARGLSPAAQLYELARIRGYVPKRPGGSSDGPGEAVDRIGRAQAANRSLAATAGSEVSRLTARDLDAMSEDEFWRFMSRNPGRAEEVLGY